MSLETADLQCQINDIDLKIQEIEEAIESLKTERKQTEQEIQDITLYLDSEAKSVRMENDNRIHNLYTLLDLQHDMIQKLQERVENLEGTDLEIMFYVPTHDTQKIDEVANMITTAFGGATIIPNNKGLWEADNDRVVVDDITIIQTVVKKDRTMLDCCIETIAQRIKRKFNQEAVFVTARPIRARLF